LPRVRITNAHIDSTVENASNKVYALETKIEDLTTKIDFAEETHEEDDAIRYQEDKANLERKLPIAKIWLEIAKVQSDEKLSQAEKADHRKVLMETLKELGATPEDVKTKPIPEADSSHSTAIEKSGSGSYTANQGARRGRK
jgi:hypothetical protein